MKKFIAILLLLVLTIPVEAGKPSYSSGKPTYSSSKPSYSSGKPTYSSGSKPSTTPSAKPSGKAFDSLGGKEQMKVESRQSYQKATAPKAEYKTPSGKTVKIDPKDVKIERLRTQLDHQKWANRDLRQQQFYGTYYSRPVVVYNDPYPSFFWWWLLDRSLNERAMWAYNHQNDMDQARLRALYAKDAQLEARVRQLEMEKKGVKDTCYTPAGLDNDLMYSNDYIDAVYNPQPQGSGIFWKIVLYILLACFVAWLVWFIFIRQIS